MKRILTLFASLLLLTAVCLSAASCGSSGSVTLAEDKYKDVTVDLGAYIASQNDSYQNCYYLDDVVDDYKNAGYLAQLVDNATFKLDKKRVDTEKVYIVNDVKYQYAYYADGYQRQGVTFPFTLESFAAVYCGYGSAYDTLEAYAQDMAETTVKEKMVAEYVLDRSGTAPTDAEVQKAYDENIAYLRASNPTMSREDVENYFSEIYGKAYLRETVRYGLVTEKLQDYAMEHCTFSLPEVTEITYDKTGVDAADCEKTSEATDLVRLDIENADRTICGSVIIRLYPETAPLTVSNFKKLVGQGFYDGLTFHRVIKGFMIQGGDPKGDGTGSSSATVTGEFYANGYCNPLLHTRGVVSMARSNDNNSGSCQFFIMHADAPHLDGDYASFGYVVYGMDTVDAIALTPTNSSDKPTNTVTITAAYFVTER